MMKTDRRVVRTRELLQRALIELISESGYDAITVQDIVDRANVGRTTFYLHYNSKDDLFVSCHEAIVREFSSGPPFSQPLSREELLSPEPSPGAASAYQHLHEARARLYPIFHGKDGPLIVRRIRDQSAQAIEANLRAVFGEADSAIPLDILSTYLVAAQIAMVQWWLEKRQHLTPESLARAFHRLRSAIVRDAFGLRDGK